MRSRGYGSGRAKRHGLARRSALPRLRLQTLKHEDLRNERPIQDRGEDLQFADAAMRAALHGDLEREASAKTNVDSSYAAAKTRLSSLVQRKQDFRYQIQ